MSLNNLNSFVPPKPPHKKTNLDTNSIILNLLTIVPFGLRALDPDTPLVLVTTLGNPVSRTTLVPPETLPLAVRASVLLLVRRRSN